MSNLHHPMKISVEPFTIDLAAEIVPLGQQSWDECSEVKKDTCAYHGQRGLPIDPDIAQYLHLEEQRALVATTLRDEAGTLRGYSLAILYRSLHLKTETCGNVDTFYVQRAYRRSMPIFMTRVEATLRELGISIIAWPVTRTGNLYKILQRRGYVADDVVMELKLKDLEG
jgi:hypothetical protein